MPKIKITNRILLGFLVKERIKGLFIKRMNEQNVKQSTVDHFEPLINDEQSHDAFTYAFTWTYTPESDSFWNNFNVKYEKYHQQYMK